jgi:hypothetical protein
MLVSNAAEMFLNHHRANSTAALPTPAGFPLLLEAALDLRSRSASSPTGLIPAPLRSVTSSIASMSFSYPPYSDFSRGRCLTHIGTQGKVHEHGLVPSRQRRCPLGHRSGIQADRQDLALLTAALRRSNHKSPARYDGREGFNQQESWNQTTWKTLPAFLTSGGFTQRIAP